MTRSSGLSTRDRLLLYFRYTVVPLPWAILFLVCMAFAGYLAGGLHVHTLLKLQPEQRSDQCDVAFVKFVR